MARVEPQVKEINLKTNRLVFDNGIEYELPKNVRSLYENENVQKSYQDLIKEDRETREKIEQYPLLGEANAFTRGIGQSAVGTFLKNYVTGPAFSAYEAMTPKEDQKEKSFLERTQENLKGRGIARTVSDEEIKEKYPFSYKFGEWMGLGSDLGAPIGRVIKSPAGVGAAYGFASSPPIYEDPEGTIKGTATGAALGYGIGKLGEVASQRSARRGYKSDLEKLPREQQEARSAFRRAQAEKLEKASQELQGGVSRESLKVNDFINRALNLSESAGSREAASVEKFLTKIESGLPDNLKNSDIVKVFDSLEGRMARATPEELPLFEAAKQHLVEQIPIGAAYNRVKDKIGSQIVENFRFGDGKLGKVIDGRVRKVVEEMNPEEFYNTLMDGSFKDIIKNEVKEGFKEFYGNKYSGKSSGKAAYLRGVEERAENFVEKNMDWIEKDLFDLAKEANEWANYVHKRVSSRVRNATGSPNPTMDIPPTNQLIMPPEPVEPYSGWLARRFEDTPFTPMSDLKDVGKKSAGMGLIGKILGIPAAYGKAALKGVAGGARTGLEGTARFLTAPTRVSEMTRDVIMRGGIPVLVESIANTYPSYEKGILLDPMDRIDAVAEVENNPYIPLEQKAILQAKINRGRNIEELKEFQEEVR